MHNRILTVSIALLLLIGNALPVSAQKHWDNIYSKQDISRDTTVKSGVSLIFINKDSTFDPQVTAKLKETFFAVYPKEIKTYNKDAARQVVMIIDPAYDGVAATSGNIVRINPEWMHKHPEDLDVVTHEVMHIVQSYPSGAGPGWITEGIADYVRNEFGVNNKAADWSLTAFKSSQNYTNAYRITARFFLWITKNYQKDFVIKLNAAMHFKKYSENFWKEQTGKTVDELWTLYSQNPVI